MSLLGSIIRGGLSLRADVSGQSYAPWDDRWYQIGGSTESSAGMRVSPETAKRLTTLIACTTVRGKAIATLPIKIRTDLAAGGSKVVSNHPLFTVLAHQPNPVQTAFDFRMMLQAHVDLRGNGYAKKIAGKRGPVDQLWPMHPDRVRVEVLTGSGKLLYLYSNPLTGREERLVQEEVFHLRDWSDNAYIGQSRVTMMTDALGLALARQDFMARFMKNDARTGMLINGPAFKTEEEKKEFRKAMQEQTTGANRGKALVLPPGVTATQLGVTPVDAALIEGMKLSDQQICSGMGVLPHLVGVDAGKAATYASTEQFNIMHAQQCVHPIVVMWEQAIQRDLITSDNYYAKFSMAALLRGDNATRFAGYTAAIAAGWMCPDDIRELEDLNPIPDGAGKVFWRSANLLPLKQLAAPAKPVANSATVPQDDEAANDADAPEDGAGGESGSEAQAAMHGRMMMLASASADRCVRREVSGVRKLIGRKAGAYEVTEFYAEHARFVAEVFHLEAGSSLAVKATCDERATHLTNLLADEDDEFSTGAQVWIEHIAATEPQRLAALAVEGIQ